MMIALPAGAMTGFIIVLVTHQIFSNLTASLLPVFTEHGIAGKFYLISTIFDLAMFISVFALAAYLVNAVVASHSTEYEKYESYNNRKY